MNNKSCLQDAAYELFFTSLSNPNRLKILNELRKKRMNVSEICKKTGFEQTMVSHNLKRLEHCGMIFSQKEGRFKYFQVNEESILPILNLIDKHMNQFCCKIIERSKPIKGNSI